MQNNIGCLNDDEKDKYRHGEGVCPQFATDELQRDDDFEASVTEQIDHCDPFGVRCDRRGEMLDKAEQNIVRVLLEFVQREIAQKVAYLFRAECGKHDAHDDFDGPVYPLDDYRHVEDLMQPMFLLSAKHGSNEAEARYTCAFTDASLRRTFSCP